MTIHEHLKSIGACNTAINWASTRKTGQQCWDETDRIDWIFWWAKQSKQIDQLAICNRLINATADAYAASLAFDKQKALILKIAKETLVCPFPN
jgi:hypothetical protein